MAEKTGNEKLGKYIAVILVVAIIAAIGVYAYTNFIEKEPSESENNNNTPPVEEPEQTLLTISVGSQVYNYSLDDLTALSSVSGQGGYINQKGKITGPYNYTGVAIQSLFGSIPSFPNNYTIRATASDEYNVSYTMDEINGKIPLLNETGAEIQIGNLTMIVAYKESGVFLNETTKGPLRIAFIDTEPSLTNSGLWLGSLVKIEVIPS